MALQDFTISFTTTPTVQFNDHSQGSIGSASNIFADVAVFNKIGPASTINSFPLLQPFLLQADIIHYSDIAEFKTDEIIMSPNSILRASGPARTWGMETVRLNVVNCVSDTILNVDESKSVIINNGVGIATELSLPTNANAGVMYTFVRTSSSGLITVNTENDLGIIHDSGGATSSGITLDSIGAKLTVVSLGVDDKWATLNAQDTTSTIVSAGELIIRTADMHLDASDTSSLVITSSPDVDQWNDQTLNGNDVAQGTPADKPHTGATIGGLNALSFDGLTQYLINSTAGGTFSGSAGEIIVVLELSAVGSEIVYFGGGDEALNSTYLIPEVSASDEIRIVQQNAGDGNDIVDGTTTSPLLINTPYILSISSDGAAYLLSVDDVVQTKSVAGGSDSGDWFADTPSRDNFTIGGLVTFGGLVVPLNGIIGEVIVFDGAALSSSDRTDVVDHLKTKWGI
jgi:hypothetical protein